MAEEKSKLSEKDLDLLNSKKGLFALLSESELNYAKALRSLRGERQIAKMQEELIKLQTWVIDNNKRVVVVFEGRDAAGKGGTIRRITHYMNPRAYRVWALPKPTSVERGQWYFQRYIQRLPDPGEIVFFDRSWYNRAVVEPVNGFCTQAEYERFMNEVNQFEEMLVNDGIYLLKVYLSISKSEQAKRFADIKTNPLKRWKITPVDQRAQELWDVYTEYKEKMFNHTNTKHAPWHIVQANRKVSARPKVMQLILDSIPYED